MLRARWVTLRARWVTLRARWVTLRARWVTLRARWATQTTGRVFPLRAEMEAVTDPKAARRAVRKTQKAPVCRASERAQLQARMVQIEAGINSERLMRERLQAELDELR
jgi:hypothetical protein